MGVFDAIRGRDDDGKLTRTLIDAQNISDAEGNNDHTATLTADNKKTGSIKDEVDGHHVSTPKSSDEINGADYDEREADRDPTHVTEQVDLGQQKAEAAALVWSRPVAFMIYGW